MLKYSKGPTYLRKEHTYHQNWIIINVVKNIQSDCAASHHHHLSFLLCNAQALLRRLIHVWHLIIGPSHLVCLKLIKRMKISQPRTEQTASPTLEGNYNLIRIGFSFAADDKSQQFNWYQCVSEHLDFNWIALLNIAGWKNINFRPI